MAARRKTTYHRTSYRDRKPAKKKKAFPLTIVLGLVVIVGLAAVMVMYLDLGQLYRDLFEERPEGDLIDRASSCINKALADYGAAPERMEFGSSGQQSRFGKKSQPRATAELPSAYSLFLVQRSLDSALSAHGFSVEEAFLSQDQRRLDLQVSSSERQPLVSLTLISSPLLSPQTSNLAVAVAGLESAPDKLVRDFLRLDFPVTFLFDFQSRETLGLLSLAKDSGKEVALALPLGIDAMRASARWYNLGRKDPEYREVVAGMLERFSFVKGVALRQDSLEENELPYCGSTLGEIASRNGYLLAPSPRLYDQLREIDTTSHATVLGREDLLQTHLMVSGSMRHRLLVLGDVVVHRKRGIVLLEASSETLAALKTVLSDYRTRNLNLVFVSELT
jgi:hypothetical protein